MKWLAGFETALVHWNGRCMASQTGHLPERQMAENYLWALSEGFAGARDGLPWRFDPVARVRAVPQGFPVVWSLHHFGPAPPYPATHALRALGALPPDPLILPVVEPSVGYAVSGLHPHEATELALTMMQVLEGRARILTGDPIHRLEEWEWQTTDRLVATGNVAVVGVHCYAHHLCVPLGDVIQAAKERYGLPVVLGETSFHDGHPWNQERPHGCATRAEWKAYVEREAQGADWACWMPVLGINWEGDDPWPSSW